VARERETIVSANSEHDPTLAQARVGTTIGEKYRLLELLGAGGMGLVYRAENTWTKRIVAIKILHPELCRRQRVVRRFLMEARHASRIEHPNIVQVLDLGKSDSDHFMVQEFLTGFTLREYLRRRGRLPLDEAVGLMMPIMSALAAAHQLGILHRDVKPDNILLVKAARAEPPGESRFTPKLIDFGIAKVLGEVADMTQTATGTPIGTPQYMSPEQLRSDKSIDERADIWSVGVVLYQLLSGDPPFTAPSYSELIVAIMTTVPKPLRTLAPELPEAIDAIVMRALEPSRERRFATMRAMLDELKQVMIAARSRPDVTLGGEDSGEISLPAVRALGLGDGVAEPGEAAPTVVPATSPGPVSRELTRAAIPSRMTARKALWIPVATGLVAIGVLVLVLALRGSSTPSVERNAAPEGSDAAAHSSAAGVVPAGPSSSSSPATRGESDAIEAMPVTATAAGAERGPRPADAGRPSPPDSAPPEPSLPPSPTAAPPTPAPPAKRAGSARRVSPPPVTPRNHAPILEPE
jgi:serine/threonine-protein kinase